MLLLTFIFTFYWANKLTRVNIGGEVNYWDIFDLLIFTCIDSLYYILLWILCVKFRPFSPGFALAVITNLALTIGGIQFSDKPIWLAIFEFAFLYTQDRIMLISFFLAWVGLSIMRFFEASKLNYLGQTGKTLSNFFIQQEFVLKWI